MDVYDHFIQNFSLEFDFIEKSLAMNLLSNRKETLINIEKKTETRIIVKNNMKTIKIEGDRFTNVQTAQKLLGEAIKERCHVYNFPPSHWKRLFNKANNVNKSIVEGLKVHLDWKRMDEDEYKKLLIIGDPKEVTKARNRYNEAVYQILQEQFEKQHSNHQFNQKKIPEGEHQVRFIEGQLLPSPQLFYVDFYELDQQENHFTSEDITDIKPLTHICKNVAIKAPFEGKLYRAQVLSIRKTETDVKLLVEYPDWGNRSEVSFYDCRYLESQLLYPPLAIACQLKDYFSETYTHRTLEFFRSTIPTNLVVKIDDEMSSTSLLKVKVRSSDLEDFENVMVENCDMVRKEVALESPDDFIGRVPIVFAYQGTGGYTRLTVSKTPSRTQVPYQLTKNLHGKKMIDSCKAAYSCAKKMMSENGNYTLAECTVKLSLLPNYQLKGPSAGAAMCLAFISFALRRSIPSSIFITGEIKEDGTSLPVGDLKLKLLAGEAKDKTFFFCPH